MKRQTRFLLIISIISILGIIVLQITWLSNYFQIHKEGFNVLTEKSIRSSLLQERVSRNERIEKKIAAAANDTSLILLRSRFLPKYAMFQHLFISARDQSDFFAFAHALINFDAGKPGSDSYKKVTAAFAAHYRINNIDRGIIDYTPEAIGFYADSLVKNYPFDSAAFCKELNKQLYKQNIYTDFKVSVLKSSGHFQPVSVSWLTQINSEIFPVNTNSSRVFYIQVLFQLPYTYLLQKMLALLIGSVLLITITGYCFYRILRSLYLEKRLSAIKNDFISNITHEFKTPIATVTAAIEALENFGAYDEPQKRTKYFKTARKEILRLSEMVNKILNISIYEKREIEIRKTSIDPASVIKEIVNNYEMIRTKKINWLISAQEGITMRADKELLHIALSNVIDNAIKYSKDPVNIRIDVYKKDKHIFFLITDDGNGMTQDQIPFVFEKFYRVHSNTEVKGYGLGLSYTKSIVDAHKGTVHIESAADKGTSFTLVFPV